MAKKRGKSKAVKSVSVAKPVHSVTEAESGTLTGVNQPMKLCRLCESKDGPFLNIFDAEKVIAKKIDDLLPFGIAENDDLPHKICFRCSAKLEELHEFIQKCINTQQNLRLSLGKTSPVVTRTNKEKLLWKKKSISKKSHNAICDAVVKKAMEGIKYSLNDVPEEHETSQAKTCSETSVTETLKKSCVESLNTLNEPNKSVVSPSTKPNVKYKDTVGDVIKEVKLTLNKCDEKINDNRSSRSSTIIRRLRNQSKIEINNKNQPCTQTTCLPNDNSENSGQGTVVSTRNLNIDIESHKIDKTIEELKENPKFPEKQFNIMDHVSTIKVSGVGVLFQCKICNRNFLKRDVVISHGCSKTGIPKEDFTKTLIPPEPRKTPVIKYINTKLESAAKITFVPENESDNIKNNPETVNSGGKRNDNIKKACQPKPKIGPASKVKRGEPSDINPIVGKVVSQIKHSPAVSQVSPFLSVKFPPVANLNCPYKLVPGPNNTFTLVEEQDQKNAVNSKTSTKRFLGDELQECVDARPKQRKRLASKPCEAKVPKNKIGDIPDSETIDLENPSTTEQQVIAARPYPVGLFQTKPPMAAEPIFSTSVLKNQAYTVVQTDNPSKLLISKSQLKPKIVPTKRIRKPNNVEEVNTKQPFSVTLEDTTPPKDESFFTFVNVDPLLQPSYVLPTDNIQEAPILSASTNARSFLESKVSEKDHYTCNMCGEIFTREQKLLAHIHSHYNKIEEEDQLKFEKTILKNTSKRGCKKTTK